MRFLERQSGSLRLTEDLLDHEIPSYAILSHTWGHPRNEVSFKDMIEGTGLQKAGYEKINFCNEKAAKDDLQHFWVDTCCIDRSNAVELQEAIFCMFRWYQRAAKCYVYLSDVSTRNHTCRWSWEQIFRGSRWFNRSWTLQELLAPPVVEFYSQEGWLLGNKKELEDLIEDITRIPVRALHGTPMSEFDIDERLSWTYARHTTRGEDEAYSLLGIFGISMLILYGEGRESAIKRFKRKLYQASKEQDNEETQSNHSVEEAAQRSSDDMPNWAALQTLNGHRCPVWSVVFSPDGRQLASVSDDMTIRLWDPATGDSLQILKGHRDAVRSVAFSPDGMQLASASSDRTVRIWDPATGGELQILQGHSGTVWSVVFSPNSRQLASASDDMTIRLWDPATGGELQMLKGHSVAVSSVAFSPDGRYLASTSVDLTVRLWDLAAGGALQILEGHSDADTSVAFSPGSRQLASACQGLTGSEIEQ